MLTNLDILSFALGMIFQTSFVEQQQNEFQVKCLLATLGVLLFTSPRLSELENLGIAKRYLRVEVKDLVSNMSQFTGMPRETVSLVSEKMVTLRVSEAALSSHFATLFVTVNCLLVGPLVLLAN
jgi:hypothetical protein